MFERILAPLDGSAAAEAVLGPLRRLLRRKDAEVILFQAVSLPPSVEFNNAAFLLEGMEKEAAAYLNEKRAELESQGIQARTMVRTGRAADSILGAAEETGAALIAMSTHGRSGLVRWVLGSVTEDVLRRSGVPVFAAHATPPDIRTSTQAQPTILVPFDGSEESMSTAPLALEVAKLFEARVAVLRVEDGAAGGPDLGFVGLMMDGPAGLDNEPDLLDRDLIEAGNRFAREGVPTTLFRVRGDTATKINHLARILPAEMIVMASHGRQGVSRLITGSVAEEVIRHAEAPVLVKRIGADAAAPVAQERRVS